MDASGEGRSRRKWLQRLGLRFTVASRLMLALSVTAALSAALAMTLHDRALSGDLERAAQQRLARAAQAANRLAEGHLEAMRERYRAISGTPQLRANLEVDHPPTLAYYAETLGAREDAVLVAFLGPDGSALASAGDTALLAVAQDVGSAALVPHEERAHAVVAVDLHTSAGRVGRMLAAERIGDETLARWSELSGVDVTVSSGNPGGLARSARSLGGLDIFVAGSLAAEREALRRSRANLLFAGSIAVALSLVACALLARGFVRPILAIQQAADRIRRGDRDVRLASRRADEIGDVARAFDLMLDGLSESQQHLSNAQEMARLGSFELDFEKKRPLALRGSDQLRSLLQVGDSELDAELLLERVHPDDRADLVSTVVETLEGGNALRSDFRLKLPDGSERIIHAQAQLSAGRPADVSRLEGTVQDVTDRRRADEQIRFLAHHDALTGLGNHRLFAERVDLTTAQARRRGGRFGILFIDLDQFARINATLGQSVGDEVLRRVADRLARSVRESDVVTSRGLESAVSRLHGDEFALLLNEIEDPQDLAFVATRILDAIGRPLEIEGHDLVLGASIGIASWPSDGDDVDALLRSASSAMQHAKERGGSQYQFYDESMNVTATELLALESRLRRALARDEFEMHYQPKVALADGRITGYEALLRWRDPHEGLLAPGAFIPVAEQCGLIIPLGEFALRESCRQLAVWLRETPDGIDPRVAVNLSAHQFKAGNLVETVADALRESGAPADRLELEITESAVLHDEAGVVSDLERLRELGISISLDDFGTGQSSLSHLRRLPVDTLKIDMSFVRNIVDSEADARLTAAIVAMGHARGLCVVAEGVETEEQRQLLADWGCDEIQGYLISRPVPAEDAILLARLP